MKNEHHSLALHLRRKKMKISNKKYQTIYADPPWAMFGGGKIKRGADKHYPLMKTKDINSSKIGHYVAL